MSYQKANVAIFLHIIGNKIVMSNNHLSTNKEIQLLHDQIEFLKRKMEECFEQNSQINNKIKNLKMYLKQAPVTELQFQKKMLHHFEHVLHSIQKKHKYWRIMPKSWANNMICRRLRKNIKHLEAFQGQG